VLAEGFAALDGAIARPVRPGHLRVNKCRGAVGVAGGQRLVAMPDQGERLLGLGGPRKLLRRARTSPQQGRGRDERQRERREGGAEGPATAAR
jgi:hypothetical protein